MRQRRIFETYNVIPERAHLAGTVRAFSPGSMATIEKGVRRIAESVSAGFGVHAAVNLRWLCSRTINNAEQAEFAADACNSVVGVRRVDRNPVLIMASEDFSAMLNHVPGCFINIGTGDGKSVCEVHNQRYDFNDGALPLGVSLFARLVERRLMKR